MLPALALGAFAAVGLLRLAEMAYARTTARRLAAAGARLVRDDGMGLIVATHAAWFVAAAAEASWAGEALGWWTALGVALFLSGLLLRYASMAVLGWRWNTRVWVLPGPLVARGPYRLLRHPIYLGVALELLGLPLAFGLWRTAIALSLAHVPVILRRIRKEDAALAALRRGPSPS